MFKTYMISIQSFGLKTTFKLLFYPRILSLFTKTRSFLEIRRPYVRDYIYNEIEENIAIHRKKFHESVSTISEDCPIWVCWWQGFDEMPELAKLCYKFLMKNKGKHSVIFIDHSNYLKYVHLPEIIQQRLNNSEISITHYTDILRFALLKEYGGIWLDALILMIKPLNIHGQVFYSNKNVPRNNDYISACRWTGGVLASGKNNELVKFVYDSYISYWTKNCSAIDYMIMDYIIDIGYNEIPEIKKMIDDVKINNPNFYALKSIFNKTVDISYVERIYEDTELLSLNRRLHCEEKDVNGQFTYFGYFKNKL